MDIEIYHQAYLTFFKMTINYNMLTYSSWYANNFLVNCILKFRDSIVVYSLILEQILSGIDGDCVIVTFYFFCIRRN